MRGTRISGVAALVLGAALATGGCASAAMSAPASAADSAAPRQVFGDIERLQFSKQVQVRLPAKLAVADVTGWDSNRRAAQAIAALAEDPGTWSDVTSVFFAPGERDFSFEDLRAAAARQQSDLMIVAQRTEVSEQESNGLGIFKILILPMLFLPTEDLRTTVGVRAAVIDVRNGLVYTTFDTHKEREATTTYAGADTHGRRDRDELFTETLTEMRTTLARKLRTLEGTH